VPDWLREHIGEIALAIYIFYPILKRWWDRRKKRGQGEEAQTEADAQSGKTEPARPPQQETPRPGPSRPDTPRPRRAPAPSAARETPKRPSQTDFVEAALARADRLKADTSALLTRAEADPRLVRLAPALREDLLARIDEVTQALRRSPTISTIVQETTVLQGLEELFRYLSTMARQRTSSRASFLADADAMADACYAPILEHARVQGLNLRTSTPVTITGDWGLSIVPRFASTRVAPLRLPAGFGRDVRRWPAIAHEVAHDFYYSLDSIEDGLHERLSLPYDVAIPSSERELSPQWLRELYGPWMSEIFADTLGTVMLGPAYVEAMRDAFRKPGSPQQTAAIFQEGGQIDEHPPDRLRVYMATRVLHYLGRHDEAESVWERWEADHPDVRFYYLPLGGNWVGLADDHLHSIADDVVDTFLERPWPELEGFQLLNVPGLAYLHADHSTVELLVDALSRGDTVRADPRWIIAAAVLAVIAQPTLDDTIREAAARSIRGVGEPKPTPSEPRPRARSRSIGAELRASTRSPAAIVEAITLAATLGDTRPLQNPNHSRGLQTNPRDLRSRRR
jgi:hypothetical protein